MKFRTALRPAMLVILGGLMLGSAACRKPKQASEVVAGPPVEVARELLENRLGEFPGAVYRSQADSPIHWQPWTPDTMARAKAANRLVFAVIAMPQQPSFQEVLKLLAEDPATVSLINDEYVPVLIDGDAAREMGLLSADLCAEIRRPLQLPIFLWMTHEANPVAWLPVAGGTSESLSDLFGQSHSMVSSSWKEDPDYVLKNSALDNASRQARVGRRRNTEVTSEKPAEDALRAVRQLISYYDPVSRSFDESGGLFPAGSIDLLAATAVHPGLPQEVRENALEIIRELLKDILPSAMIDPLDGGIFAARRGSSWSYPSFSRDCPSEARAAVALLNAAKATGDIKARDVALGIIDFAERNFSTSEDLFAVGLSSQPEVTDWLWSVEDIEKELPGEDAAWWIAATGMKGLGNLPPEADPRREHFRSNTLGLLETPDEIAARLGVPAEEFRQRFELTRKKLLKVRNERRGELARDDSSHANSSFRMVSAYAAAFTATGEEAYRQKAIELLQRSRTAFSDGEKLREFSRETPPSIGAGRAFIYGLALQAALDVASITSDNAWLLWADDVATIAAELFTKEGILIECPEEARILEVPVTDLVMLFDDSTAGLISSAEARLAAGNRPLLEDFSKLATPLPAYAPDRPILHTDLVQATIARHFPVVVVTGAELPAELKQAVERLPMRMIQRRTANPKDDVPANSVKLILGNGEPQFISTPDALQQALAVP